MRVVNIDHIVEALSTRGVRDLVGVAVVEKSLVHRVRLYRYPHPLVRGEALACAVRPRPTGGGDLTFGLLDATSSEIR